MRKNGTTDPPGAEDVAVAHDGELGPIRPGKVVRGDEDLVGSKFGGAVEIDGIGRLVGGQRDHLLHIAPQRRVDDVLGTEHIGADALEGIVFGRRDLLERRGVYDIIDVAQRHIEPVAVADVADEIADKGILTHRELKLHVGLLELVAGKDDDPPRLVAGDDRLHEMLAEGPRAAGDENGLVVQVEPGLGKFAEHGRGGRALGQYRRAGQRNGGLAHGQRVLFDLCSLPKRA
ncbi:MAG: hypothetical protein WDM81_19090 [Rhizomicrobium sp.]